jgi:diguanylate cyclase (GGDEF)-like protein
MAIYLGIAIYFMSLRAGQLPVFLRIITTGLFTFAVVDLVYFYLDFKGQYIPNSFIDFAYICAFEFLAAGALWRSASGESIRSAMKMDNGGRSLRWTYLLVFPIINILYLNFRIADLIFYGIMIFFYAISSGYVQVSVEKEQLLLKEKNMNELLEQRVQEQVRELTFLANQDTLTSLLNRRSFMAGLEDTIRTLRQGETVAVMLLDLDRFKNINDSYGHDMGDIALIEVSQRLMRWNSCGATLARLGADEFAVVIVGHYTGADLREYGAELVEACGKPLQFGEEEVRLTVSLGAATLSQGACSALALMKNADIAMYRAKSQGYNKLMFYEDILGDTADKRIEIERLLRKADFTKDFELFYQPQFSIGDRRLIGAEALIRWKSAEHGYIPPNEFIPVAEELGYILDIGKWVMSKTIGQCLDWNSRCGLALKLSFNISPKQLDDDGFADVVRDLISLPGFDTSWLDAEITENIMIKDEDNVRTVFELFSSLGISVSIDDFGAGYSSFGNLNRFSFHRIKIDKALIDQISTGNFSGIQVVKAIIMMANALGVTTIAEGVENKEQLDILARLGCDQAQGYLLGRPVPAEVFEEMFILKVHNEKRPARAQA